MNIEKIQLENTPLLLQMTASPSTGRRSLQEVIQELMSFIFLSPLMVRLREGGVVVGTKIKQALKRKPFKITPLLIFIILALLAGGVYFWRKNSKAQTSSSKNASTENTKFSQSINIDKTVEFPAMDSRGKYTQKIFLTVVSVEKTNEVLVKNEPIRAKEGRFFLIVSLDLENKTNEKLALVCNDLIRLRIGENGKRIAPDLHNRQVLVSPISVKADKVGFVVIDSQGKSLTLELGEFNKTKEAKEKIEIKF